MIATRQELDDFHRFAVDILDRAASHLSMEELLSRWLAARERAEANSAIQAGLADFAAGRVRLAKEAMEDIRAEFDIPKQ